MKSYTHTCKLWPQQNKSGEQGNTHTACWRMLQWSKLLDPSSHSQPPDVTTLATIPYVQVTSEPIKRLLSPYNTFHPIPSTNCIKLASIHVILLLFYLHLSSSVIPSHIKHPPTHSASHYTTDQWRQQRTLRHTLQTNRRSTSTVLIFFTCIHC